MIFTISLWWVRVLRFNDLDLVINGLSAMLCRKLKSLRDIFFYVRLVCKVSKYIWCFKKCVEIYLKIMKKVALLRLFTCKLCISVT